MRFLVLLILGFSFLFASVDINSAPKSELMQLKGIGKKKAEAIVVYRKSHCFKSVDALVNVKGIGKKTLEKNREKIVVGKCEK